MAIIKCKMCGGDLVLQPDSTVAECEYCGTIQTVPTQDNEKKLTLFARANRLRAACEFDKAAGIYETIVADFPEEAESYWGLVLCKYGIEYVDDPATGNKIPTCHRSSFESVLRDSDFEQAMENADAAARRVYREEAKTIETIRRGILDVSANEKPYDIFICYKETDDSGNRTLDSLLAQDIYDALTARNYRVFFSRISLEDKLGQAYEPYIFAALNSAKIMLAVGTCYEHYNAVWVKNEWSRFLKLMAKDKSKYLFPCYKNIDPYDIPAEFSHLQGQDLGKIGAMQDLLRGISKILDSGKKPAMVKETVILERSSSAAPLLRRAFLFLEDGDWANADEYCEKVLDQDPENALAYVGKLMAQLHIRKQENLKDCREPFDGENHYQKAIRFADEALEAELTGYIAHIRERNETARKTSIYDDAVRRMNNADTEGAYQKAAEQFEAIPGFRDADALAQQCREKIEAIRAEKARIAEEKARIGAQKKQEQETMRQKNAVAVKKRSKTVAILALVAVVCAAAVLLAGRFLTKDKTVDISLATDTVTESIAPMSPEEKAYAQAAQWEAEGQLAKAAIAFYKMGDYGDARERSFEIWSTVTERNVVHRKYDPNQKKHLLAGVQRDGSVIVANLSEKKAIMQEPAGLSDWTDVVSICGSNGSSFWFGLRSDGTVLSANWGTEVSLDVSGWEDIVWIDNIANHYGNIRDDYVIGLKADGTVVTAGTSSYVNLGELSAWTDIAKLYCTNRRYILGLKTDGTVVHAGAFYGGEAIDTSGWTNIVDLRLNSSNIIGLRADGTVVAVGDNSQGQCDVSHWTDITEIEFCDYNTHHHTVGLKSDGTVVAAGDSSVRSDMNSIAQWTDIEQISAGYGHVVGLRSDGTVVSAGLNNQHCTKVSHMTDVEQIITSYALTAGLRSDGTLVLAGANNYTPKASAQWKDIQQIMCKNNTIYAWCSDGSFLYQSYYHAYNIDLTGWTNMKLPTTPKRPVAFETGMEAAQDLLQEDQATAYAEAEALLASGETAKAAIAFGKLGDYADARERSFSLWDQIAVRETLVQHGKRYQVFTAGLQADGTILITGIGAGMKSQAIKWNNLKEQVGHWSDIIAIADNGALSLIGLREDGTVITSQEIDGTAAWRDIVAIDAGSYYAVGLRNDGTVVASGENNYGQCDVSNWTNIVAISAHADHTVGLRSNGTVVAVGWNESGECAVDGWSNIVAIYTGSNYTLGLKDDGTVLSTGAMRDYEGTINVSDWTDIVDITCSDTQAIGTKSDGTFVTTGNNRDGALNISEWTEIVNVIAGDYCTFGQKADGTVVHKGNSEWQQEGVTAWTDIKLPNS